MVVNPLTNVICVLNEPLFRPPGPNEGISIPTYYLEAVNGTSGRVLSENVTQVGGFWTDLNIDPNRNIVYVNGGTNGFTAIDGFTNELIDDYYFKVSNELFTKKMVVDSQRNILYFVGVKGLAAIRGTNIVPEFGSSLVAITGFISMAVIIVFAMKYWPNVVGRK